MRPAAHFCGSISGIKPKSRLPPHNLRNQITKMRLRAHCCDLISGKAQVLATDPPQPRVGDDGGGAAATTEEFPQSTQSRKSKSLAPIYIYIYIYMLAPPPKIYLFLVFLAPVMHLNYNLTAMYMLQHMDDRSFFVR